MRSSTSVFGATSASHRGPADFVIRSPCTYVAVRLFPLLLHTCSQLFQMTAHATTVQKTASVSSAVDGMGIAAVSDSGPEMPSPAMTQTNGTRRKISQEQASNVQGDDDNTFRLLKPAAGARVSSTKVVVRKRERDFRCMRVV